jgi:hypothetical protein
MHGGRNSARPPSDDRPGDPTAWPGARNVRTLLTRRMKFVSERRKRMWFVEYDIAGWLARGYAGYSKYGCTWEIPSLWVDYGMQRRKLCHNGVPTTFGSV